MTLSEAVDILRTLQNRIDLCLIIIEGEHGVKYLHTLFEDIFEDAQELMSGFCVHEAEVPGEG